MGSWPSGLRLVCPSYWMCLFLVSHQPKPTGGCTDPRSTVVPTIKISKPTLWRGDTGDVHRDRLTPAGPGLFISQVSQLALLLRSPFFDSVVGGGDFDRAPSRRFVSSRHPMYRPSVRKIHGCLDGSPHQYPWIQWLI